MTKEEKRNHDLMAVQTLPSEEQAAKMEVMRLVAHLKLRPSIQAAGTLRGYLVAVPDDADLAGELDDLAQAVNDGDLKRAEEVLVTQGYNLNAIFNNLGQRAINAEYMDTLEPYLRLALKAQNQCRQTLATLGELKHPRRATFIKQQNNAINQQVNNTAPGPEENPKISGHATNELLEALPHERLDTGTAGTAIATNPNLEAVEEGRG